DTFTNHTLRVTNLVDQHCTAYATDLTGSATVRVDPRPTAAVALNGPAEICNGQQTTVQAALHGLGPWVVTWSDGTLQVSERSPVIYPAANLTNTYADTFTNYTLRVTNLLDQHCSAVAADLSGNATVRVDPRPAAVVSLNGPTEICNGQ